MSITTKMLYSETYNFIKQQINSIIIIIFISSCITSIIDNIFSPNIYEIYNLHYNHIDNIFTIFNLTTIEQKIIIFKLLCFKIISNLLNYTLLFSILISYITIISKYHSLDIKSICKKVISIFPYLLILTLLISIIIQLGFMLFILPGIIGTILLSLSPIILVIEKKTILHSIYDSINYTKNNISSLLPAVILWMSNKFITYIFIKLLYILPIMYITGLHIFINNFIISIVIIYLYRFYIITKQ
ncbi:MAG: YciC family protein [Buchnera aphidicola (Eriosoma harunire)]